MSILTLAFPAQAAVSAMQVLSGAAAFAVRSILEISILGVIAVFVMVFKPLIVGSLRAAQLVTHPRVSAAQRQLLRRIEGAQLLNQLAKDADATQPNLAAEMRYLAARG
jgi:hypothetical protein